MSDGQSLSRGMPRWVGYAAAALFVALLLYVLRGVLTPVFFAFLIAYVLDPVVDRLEERRIPRALAVTIVLTAVLLAGSLFLLLVAPAIVRETIVFARELPDKAAILLERSEAWLGEFGVAVPHTLDEALTQLELDVPALAQKAVAPAGVVLGWIVGGTASFLGALAGLLVVPVFAGYLLYDFDRLVAGVRDLIPWRIRPRVVQLAGEIDEVLGQFMRGQLLVMIALAILYSGGYAIVGVPLALPIGIIAGFLSFIPYVGGAIALGLGVLMSLLDWDGWIQLLGVVGIYSLVQLLESFIITPRVVGEKVGLSAVWVLFALMVGGEAFGFLGVLLALPAAAVIKILVGHGVVWYRQTSLFTRGRPAQESHEAQGTSRDEPAEDDPRPPGDEEAK